jgi:hypothetical protein
MGLRFSVFGFRVTLDRFRGLGFDMLDLLLARYVAEFDGSRVKVRQSTKPAMLPQGKPLSNKCLRQSRPDSGLGCKATVPIKFEVSPFLSEAALGVRAWLGVGYCNCTGVTGEPRS